MASTPDGNPARSGHGPRESPRRRGADLLLLFATVVLCVALGEGILRWVFPLETIFIHEDPELGFASIPNKTGTWLREAERPVRVEINSKRLRDVERPYEKPPGEVRVLMLGDSFIAAFNMPFERIASQLLQMRLRHSLDSDAIEVVNAGTQGWGTAQELLFLRAEGFRYEPDLVILNFFAGNDFGNNHVRTAAPTKARFSLENGELRLHPPERRPGLTALRDRILAHSAIARSIRPAFNRLGLGRTLAELGFVSNDTEEAHDEATQQAMQDVTQQLILTMAREAERRGARFFVHLIPNPLELTPYLPEGMFPGTDSPEEAARRAAATGMREALLEFLEQEEIAVVFAWDRMVEDSRAGRVAFTGFVGHWNEHGNLRAAEDLHRSVLPAVRDALERNQRSSATASPSFPQLTSDATP